MTYEQELEGHDHDVVDGSTSWGLNAGKLQSLFILLFADLVPVSYTSSTNYPSPSHVCLLFIVAFGVPRQLLQPIMEGLIKMMVESLNQSCISNVL